METALDTAPKPFVFVLMPFAKEFNDTYKFGIKGACEEAGAYSERVDEQHFDGSIFERIRNQIAKADVIVADMTGQNPNVFYEVGYAHALNKRVVLVTKNSSDIPFDLKHYPHIIHDGSITTLKDNLTEKLRWALSQPSSAARKDPLQLLDIRCEGCSLNKGEEVLTRWGYFENTNGRRLPNVTIAFRIAGNEAPFDLRCQLSVHGANRYLRMGYVDGCVTEDESITVVHRDSIPITPGIWSTVDFILPFSGGDMVSYPAQLFITDGGSSKTQNFRINFAI